MWETQIGRRTAQGSEQPLRAAAVAPGTPSVCELNIVEHTVVSNKTSPTVRDSM